MKILFIFVFLMSGFYIQPSFATKNKRDLLGTSLLKNVKNRNINTVKGLLKDGADVNYTGDEVTDNTTALIEASRNGDYNMVQFLLDKGADPELSRIGTATNHISSPLLVAIRNGDFNMVKFLVKRGARIPATGLLKRYPNYYKRQRLLHEAVRYKHINIVKFLLDKGVDVNAKDKNGNTTLHSLIKQGKRGLLDKNTFDIAELLLSRKADVNVKNNLGLTPFMSADSYKRKTFLKFLKANGIKGYKFKRSKRPVLVRE